jgi:hypothetical protein
MILLFLIVRRTPTIRELIVATPLSLSSSSATGLSAHAPAQRLERSDFVLCAVAHPALNAYARFLVFSARTGADWEGALRVEFTRSPNRPATSATCAKRSPAVSTPKGF